MRYDSPLELAQTTRANNDHGGFQKVNQVEQHVARVLGVQELARYSDMKSGSLQESGDLFSEEQACGLTLD